MRNNNEKTRPLVASAILAVGLIVIISLAFVAMQKPFVPSTGATATPAAPTPFSTASPGGVEASPTATVSVSPTPTASPAAVPTALAHGGYFFDAFGSARSLAEFNEPSCGDGACDDNEDCNSCASDCACGAGSSCSSYGVCVAGELCGDGTCTAKEKASAGCCGDCGCSASKVCDAARQECIATAAIAEAGINASVEKAKTQYNLEGYGVVGVFDDVLNGTAVKAVVLRCPSSNLSVLCEATVYIGADGKIIRTLFTV